MEMFWKEIDWDLAYRQKLEVLSILKEYTEESDTTVNRERIELLEGLVGLLDAIGDAAEEKGLFSYPCVDADGEFVSFEV